MLFKPKFIIMTPEQAYEKMKSLLAKEESDFIATSESFRETASANRTIFTKYGVGGLLQVKKGKFELYFEFLLDFCYSQSLFPDPNIYDDLEKLGVGSKVTQWFIDVSIINEQFKEIEKRDIVVLKNIALHMVLAYLNSKIRAQILDDCHLILGENEGGKPELINSFKNIFRRTEYGHGGLKTFKNEFDILMDGQIKQMDRNMFNDLKKTKKFYFDSFSGKVEKLYLRQLIDSLIRPEGMSGPQFAGAISGLMKLLIKGKKRILDEDEFIEGEALYGNDYNRYLANRIHKIVGLDEPDFFESWKIPVH
jgi:hypothetical protein